VPRGRHMSYFSTVEEGDETAIVTPAEIVPETQP
jgi:hypothetical protein